MTFGRLAVILLALVALVACTPEQTATYDQVNAIRAANGLNTLGASLEAMDKAQAWADHLAAAGRLEHSPDLFGGLPGDVHAVAENVGVGASIEGIIAAFLDSPAHRGNVLGPQWTSTGTGVAIDGSGRVWLVQLYLVQG